MKKLLLILLCLNVMFISCETGDINKEITKEMLSEGFTGKGTYINDFGNFGGGKRIWEKYVGEWKNSQYHGKGTFTYANGMVETGEWKNSRLNGLGTRTYGRGAWNGDIYVGEFNNGDLHGKGTYISTDGTIQKGLWRNNNFYGK